MVNVVMSSKPTYTVGPKTGIKTHATLEAQDVHVTDDLLVDGDMEITGTMYATIVTAGVTLTASDEIDADITVNAGKDITAAAGDGKLDYTSSTGTFISPSGENTLQGNVTISGAKTFTTGTGAITLAGNTSISGSKTFTTGSGDVVLAGNTSISGSKTFTTGSGAVSLVGNTTVAGAATFTTGSGKTTITGDIDLAASSDLVVLTGDSKVDCSLGTGVFKTTTGANTLSGDVTIANGKTFAMTGTGTFGTGTGNVSINGDATVAVNKALAVTTADKLTVGGVIVPQELVIMEKYNFADVDHTVFIATRAYEVVAVQHMSEIADTSGSAATVDVMKCTGTQAPHSGTSVITAACDAKAVTQTVTAKTLSATVALAAGNRLALDFTGLTDGTGIVVITLKRV